MGRYLCILMIFLNLEGFSQVSNYGYTATTSTWAANSSATTIIVNGQDELLTASQSIGFTFKYNGVSYTKYKASTNGFITFDTLNTSPQPTNNLSTSTERVILAVLWDDNKTGSSGIVDYKLTGTSPNRVLTVEWLNYRWEKYAFSAGVISCQIKLYETTNAIEFIYYRGTNAYTFQNSSNSAAFGASIGLGGATSGDFLSLSDLKASPYPTKSTSTETTTIGKSPTDFSTTSMSASLVTTYIAPNVSPGDATTYRFYPPLANDNCNGGSSLSINGGTSCTTTASGTTVGAGQSLAACVGTADDDVWYSFVATQPVHTLTEVPGTIGDAVMQVYSGSCSSLTTIACVNDATSGNETTTLSGLTIGSTYYTRVHSYANGTDQGSFSMCVNTPSTVIVSGSSYSFTACSGSASAEQNYTVSGSGLTGNITVTAPTGFEISVTTGSGFASSLTLTQTSGVVNSTTIYVRLKSSATGSPTGNITHASTNATTKNIAVDGVVYTASVGGTVAADQNVAYGENASTINLTGNTGSVIKWQSDVNSSFSTATDIANTTTSVSGSSMGAVTQTLYYRAVVQNGSCPSAYSSYATINAISTLPIALLYVEGYQHTQFENRLRWATASENNNDYFTIEKTLNGDEYVEIGRIPGAGNSSSILYYGFVDTQIDHVINYYRLKQTDYDGRFWYSEAFSVDNRDGVEKPRIINIVNMLGQKIDRTYVGEIIIIYSDGTKKRTIQF